MTVRVVCDSSGDLPNDLAAKHQITVVPLTVRFGDDAYLSGVELDGDAFWEKLKVSTEPPATAAPSAGDFQTAFEKLLADGADGVVSVHLSSKLSATFQSAVVAADAIGGGKVHVVDTLAVSAGQGLLALKATELAAEGRSAADVATEIGAASSRIRLFGALDTLEYLRRGGRIGGAQALLGTMLKVKPVISLEDGVVEPVSRVRTRAKALEYLVELVQKDAADIERIVAITGDASDGDRYVEMMNAVIPISSADVWNFGPVVGTHAGPGIVGVAYLLKPGAGGSAGA